MRKKVAEGRKQEFAAFGFGSEVPNPEEQKTYEMSKLKWEEQGEGKHAEMLAWVKALIKLRRSRVAFNDGNMHHLQVWTVEDRLILVLVRDEARVLINFGEAPYTFDLLEGETLELASRKSVGAWDNRLELPGMTLAVLLSTTEDAENRQVERQTQ